MDRASLETLTSGHDRVPQPRRGRPRDRCRRSLQIDPCRRNPFRGSHAMTHMPQRELTYAIPARAWTVVVLLLVA